MQIRLVIIDSLSSALHAHVVPALSSSVYSNLEASKENRRNSTSKRRRTTAKLDPKVEANHSIIRQLLSTAVKETLLNLSTRNVAVSSKARDVAERRLSMAVSFPRPS